MRDGARSGYIGIEFVRIELPNGEQKDIDAKLISLRQDRNGSVSMAGKVSTGRKVDVVLIGQATPGTGVPTR